MAPTNIPQGIGVYQAVPSAAADAALSREIEQVDPNARLAGLLDLHHARLYRLARRLAASQEEAKDLVQEAFLRIVRSPNAVPHGASSEEAWLVRILINVCRDQWRRKASRGRLDVQYRGELRNHVADSHEAALVARSTVWHALQQLSPRRRAAIVLYELEGLGIPEIASMLGVSAITVRWHLSLGRRELAGVIAGQKEGNR